MAYQGSIQLAEMTDDTFHLVIRVRELSTTIRIDFAVSDFPAFRGGRFTTGVEHHEPGADDTKVSMIVDEYSRDSERPVALTVVHDDESTTIVRFGYAEFAEFILHRSDRLVAGCQVEFAR